MSDVGRELLDLRSWIGQHGLTLTDTDLSELSKYLEVLRLWSRKVALVGSAEVPLLVKKHLADCLYAAARCPEEGRAADLGSGAGMPGIPIAIVRPGLEIDLIEARSKKISFLAQATSRITNAHCLNQRIETLKGRDYDIATARALAPLDRMLPLARPVLRSGAHLLAMKSDAFSQELDLIDPTAAGFRLVATDRYTLPTGEARALLCFEAL